MIYDWTSWSFPFAWWKTVGYSPDPRVGWEQKRARSTTFEHCWHPKSWNLNCSSFCDPHHCSRHPGSTATGRLVAWQATAFAASIKFVVFFAITFRKYSWCQRTVTPQSYHSSDRGGSPPRESFQYLRAPKHFLALGFTLVGLRLGLGYPRNHSLGCPCRCSCETVQHHRGSVVCPFLVSIF